MAEKGNLVDEGATAHTRLAKLANNVRRAFTAPKSISPDTWFAVRISGFVALIFSLKCAMYNLVDPQLTTYPVYGVRTYPMGHWAHVLSIPVAIGSFVCLTQFKLLALRCLLLLWSVMLVVFIATLINFNPPFPNIGFMNYMLQIAGVGAIATWVRHADTRGIPLESSASREAKIEWVKERINLWRVLTISATLGIFWIIIPWMEFLEKDATYLATNQDEQRLIAEVFRVQMWAQFLFIVLGPIYEAIARTIRMRDLFLQIE